MVKKTDSKLIVGLDIGTSKVLAIVAEIKEDSTLEIIGVGHHPAKGLRRGVVADIESTVMSIQRPYIRYNMAAQSQDSVPPAPE